MSARARARGDEAVTDVGETIHVVNERGAVEHTAFPLTTLVHGGRLGARLSTTGSGNVRIVVDPALGGRAAAAHLTPAEALAFADQLRDLATRKEATSA